MSRFDLPNGRSLSLDRAEQKLRLRAGLPGASLFDRAAHALRKARGKGLDVDARLDLAFASSWLVNSPAPSPALRALATAPLRPVLLTVIEVLEGLPEVLAPADVEDLTVAVRALSTALGDDAAKGAEALSKLLALLCPESVPLMPEPACTYLLGAPPSDPGERFVRALEVFREATFALYSDLVVVAKGHPHAVLDAAQVLDRVLWFDSEGHRHFPKLES